MKHYSYQKSLSLAPGNYAFNKVIDEYLAEVQVNPIPLPPTEVALLIGIKDTLLRTPLNSTRQGSIGCSCTL